MDKLIRDNELSIYDLDQVECHTRELTAGEFYRFIKDAYVSNADAVKKARNLFELQDALVDALEMIETMCEVSRLDIDELYELKKKKATEKGTYSKHLVLESITKKEK